MHCLTAVISKKIIFEKCDNLLYNLQKNPRTVIFGSLPPSSGNKYIFILAKWNLSVSPNQFTIEMVDNQNNAIYSPRQDNLENNGAGVFEMIIYRLAYNTGGSLTSTQNWESFGNDIKYNSKNSQNSALAENSTQSNISQNLLNKTTASNALEFTVCNLDLSTAKTVRMEW